jgi:hypothetical protein
MALPSRLIQAGIGLLAFMMACFAVIGAILFLGVRFMPHRVYVTFPEYRHRQRSCDGFTFRAYWWRTPWDGEQLVYLVAAAPVTISGQTPIIPFAEVSYDPPSDRAIVLHPLGIFVRGKRAEPPAAERVWLYLPGISDDVRAVPGTAGPETNVTMAEFEKLECLPVWKNKIRPQLIRELAAFCNDYQRKRRRDPADYPELRVGKDVRAELEANGAKPTK